MTVVGSNPGARECRQCPYAWPGDDGSAKQCIARRHCGCDEVSLSLRAALVALVADAPQGLGCEAFHHSRADQNHGSDCPVAARYEAALAAAMALIGSTTSRAARMRAAGFKRRPTRKSLPSDA